MDDDITKTELLYDEATLTDVLTQMDAFGDEPYPQTIKRELDSEAFIYEIRTAIQYWTGDSNDDYRYSDRVWQRCKAVDDGNLMVVGDELKYEADVDL